MALLVMINTMIFLIDVLVGSYRSGHAILLRSRPVLNINLDLSFEPPQIDPNQKNCMKDADGNFKDTW